MKRQMPAIRQWDFLSSQRINTLVANSSYIKKRIKKFWNRDSKVIFPPVDVDRLSPNNLPAEDFYVVFSRFVSYKRVDLAIKACGQLGKKLVVIGSGSQEAELKAIAAKYKTAGIKFTGRISDEEVKGYLQKCRAMIFSAEEDFGIIPVECQACGRPVIAFGKGGALETVADNTTGIFFTEQTEESLKEAIVRFEDLERKGIFNTEAIVKHAQKFSADRFRKELQAVIDDTLKEVK